MTLSVFDLQNIHLAPPLTTPTPTPSRARPSPPPQPTRWTWSCTTGTIRQGRRARWTCSGGSRRSSRSCLRSPRTGSCALSGTSLRGDTPRGEWWFRRFARFFCSFSRLCSRTYARSGIGPRVPTEPRRRESPPSGFQRESSLQAILRSPCCRVYTNAAWI